jgi:antitoxin YefM
MRSASYQAGRLPSQVVSLRNIDFFSMLLGTEFRCVLTRRDMDSILSMVKSITYTAARENLASTMNKVCEDQAPVIITRNRDQSVVMISLAEYEALQETAYLMRSAANAKRLIAAVDALEHGKGIKRKLHA